MLFLVLALARGNLCRKFPPLDPLENSEKRNTTTRFIILSFHLFCCFQNRLWALKLSLKNLKMAEAKSISVDWSH